MKTEILKLENLRFSYRREETLFENLSVSFRAGEFTAVIGPNGSGKSTLLQLGCGLLRPQAGRILLNGRDLSGIPAEERARHMAVTFQLASRTMACTVRELVMLGRLARRKWYMPYTREDRSIAENCLRLMDMEDKIDRSYKELSGGEKQRSLLAAALAQEPEILLLDEPAAALDFNHRCMLLNLLNRLVREKNLCVVTISHDLGLSARFADRILMMNAGKIEAGGAPREVITPENIRRCYGCPAAVIPGPEGEPIVAVPAGNSLRK